MVEKGEERPAGKHVQKRESGNSKVWPENRRFTAGEDVLPCVGATSEQKKKGGMNREMRSKKHA